MKYRITQKVMAMGGDYAVYNEAGREVFYFDGKVFNFGGKKVVVLDAKRNEVARIAKQLFTFGQSFHIKRKGAAFAKIRKRPFTFRNQFIIKVKDSLDYQVVGDFVGHEYTIKRDSSNVARVSKKFFGASDSYGVEIEGGDTLLILCSVVVIDMVLFKKLKSS